MFRAGLTAEELQPMRLKGKAALITAASGIGHASTEIMAREGGIVVALAKDEARFDSSQ
jgi:NAD(P)-dependent dehydrogenase (short-subunit alcohol dehydrogenase family)